MTKNIYQKLKSASEEARMVRKTQKKGGMNFNPLERLNQRMAGKSQGRSMAGVKKKKQSLLGKA